MPTSNNRSGRRSLSSELKVGDVVEHEGALGIICTFDELMRRAPGVRWVVQPDRTFYFAHKNCDMYFYHNPERYLKMIGHVEEG